MSLPPAQPVYILRGHAAQIHSTTFIRSNSRLVSGDADGWIVLWSLTTRRATTVWRAHEGAILGSAAWGHDRLITHGKDNKLCVWKLTEDDESTMSTILPVEESMSHRKQPWLLHALQVNTLNFCSFASCVVQTLSNISQEVAGPASSKDAKELFVAVPNVMSDESVDIFHLPSENRIHTVLGDKSVKTGMVMAVSLFYIGARLTVIAGYESGHTAISQLSSDMGWQVLYLAQPHSQPVLSLAVAPNQRSYVTSSADAIIAKHPIPEAQDNKVPDTTPQPLTTTSEAIPRTGNSLLSATLPPTGSSSTKSVPPRPPQIQTTPLKILQTKHSGQQGLKIRSDGKVLATAGWDSRVRVYSLQSLKELAVLKWHKEGCYAVAFAEIRTTAMTTGAVVGSGGVMGEGGAVAGEEVVRDADTGLQMTATTKLSSAVTLGVMQDRQLKANSTHWLAAGSKDGKVSLWDIY